jgi:hypothetical protein
MGTFVGVFLGISMFILGFGGTDEITDKSIKQLLVGVLVSMVTSLFGLLLTTCNNYIVADKKKSVEEDKNDFFDFIQTELMPRLDVSLVAAITRLHETVDKFEPAFDGVISRFQETFDRCTTAFGANFEQNVKTVSAAVNAMGKNMDRINENIRLQEQLLSTLRSGEVTRGMQKYIEAANTFASITKSLDKFEEARRMMLAAAQESINLQNSYAESLMIPLDVAGKINKILDRITKFEDSVNRIGGKLEQREILGNDVVNLINTQINSIAKKDKTAERYLEIADAELEHLFAEQTKLINEMNERYKNAIAGHIDGFEDMLRAQTEELEKRHKEFINAIEQKITISEVKNEFSNLSKLDDIQRILNLLAQDPVKANLLMTQLRALQQTIDNKFVLVASKSNGGENGGRGGNANKNGQSGSTSGNATGTGNPYARPEKPYHPTLAGNTKSGGDKSQTKGDGDEGKEKSTFFGRFTHAINEMTGRYAKKQ